MKKRIERNKILSEVYLEPLHQFYRLTVTPYGMGLDIKQHTLLQDVGKGQERQFITAMKYEQRKL